MIVFRRENLIQKDTQENFFWKEIANSTYGKLAQGLRERRIYSIEEDDIESLKPSKVTNPVFASFITGFARGVLSEIMNNLPKDKIVFSVTTDGFLTNCNEEELKESAKGQLSRYYKDSRHKLVGMIRFLRSNISLVNLWDGELEVNRHWKKVSRRNMKTLF